MAKNKIAERFLKRFEEILDEMDNLTDCEEMEELNAQLEDTIFLIESIDWEDEDAAEEFSGALDEIEDLPEQYQELDIPEVSRKARELEMAVQMARNNL